MPVRLDLHPESVPLPAAPRIWLWSGLLGVFLVLGAGALMLFAPPTLRHHPLGFWGLGLGVPLLVWSVLGFTRALIFIGQQRAAQAWNLAREESLNRKTRRGRRSQQVLSTSLYSTYRAPGEQRATQLHALLSKTKALKAEPPEGGEATARLSRFTNDQDKAHEHILLVTLQEVLRDLGQTLEQVPAQTPLALLLEVDSSVPDHVLSRVWRQVWLASGIRQSTVSVEGHGLAAVDNWLDQRINDQALLMVVALQFAPQMPEATAEVAVGLLFGNRLTQTTLAPIAYLHRPEQARDRSSEQLLYAARQALDWVPLTAPSIKQVWQSGIDREHGAGLITLLHDLAMPVGANQGLIDLDACLGHAGQASPWLAIAGATQTIELGAGPQFIFSGGGSAQTGLWSTALTPAAALSK